MIQWSFLSRSTIRTVRGKAVTARLLIGSDVPIVCRNERAEGLEIVSVHALINRRPVRRCMVDAQW